MTEVETMRQIQLAAGQFDSRLWRNNVGMAWQGRMTRLANGDVLLRNPRPVHFGLAEGSSDLIGFVVENGIARFAAVECKHKSQTSPAQQNFIRVIEHFGGLAGVARSVEEAARILNWGKS